MSCDRTRNSHFLISFNIFQDVEIMMTQSRFILAPLDTYAENKDSYTDTI